MFQSWDNCLQDGVATLQCIPIVFKNIVSGFLILSGVTALFFLAFGAITIIKSGGDPKQLDSGKKIISSTLIGLILVLCSFAIIYFISYVTGTSCITQFGFNC